MPTTPQFTASPQMLEARQQLVKIARLLIRQEHRIFEIQQALPLPASHLAMEEESIPYSAASWMYVELDRIQARGLRCTVRKLLDLSLRKRERMNKGVAGTAWEVHGGGFYHVEKYTVAPDELPRAPFTSTTLAIPTNQPAPSLFLLSSSFFFIAFSLFLFDFTLLFRQFLTIRRDILFLRLYFR